MRDRIPAKPNRYAIYDDSHNFVRYEYHERADEPTQTGDALNKANLLPDDVATALGLTGNPQVKDVLSRLSNAVSPLQYVWDKCQRNESISYGDVVEVDCGSMTTDFVTKFYTTVTISDSISISDENVISLVSPTTVEISFDIKAPHATIDGTGSLLNSKYFLVGEKCYKGDNTGALYRSSDSHLMKKASLVTATVTFNLLERVASYASGAYPQDGYQDNYKYVFVGRPSYIDTRIEFGSYIGTGGSGSDNPNSLTFEVAPKFLVFYASWDKSIGIANMSFILGVNGTFADTEWLTTDYVKGAPPFDTTSTYAYSKKSADGKTIYWYSSGSNGSGDQLNTSDRTYYYFAIV